MLPEGPVGGLLSQNCVWSSWPAGMKQQVSATAVVLWHDRGESLGQEPAAMAPAARAKTGIDFCIMVAAVVMVVEQRGLGRMYQAVVLDGPEAAFPGY